MGKKIVVALSTLLLSTIIYSQETKKDAQKAETKMELFASKTGTIVKIVDTKLPDIKLLYGSAAETRIRKIMSGQESRFFYQIESQGKYTSSTASIDYSDLLEIIKAIKSLKTDVDKDVTTNPDYLENKFTTVDGFQVGYYVSKGKPAWFLKLEKYGSENTVFVKDGDDIETVFTEAKNKIEELKK